MKNNQTVFVGLSGGVDSSVAALRLKQAGYRVVGVFIKVWQPDWLVCNWEQERLDAMRVAAALDIPFLTCDAEEQYRDDVAEYFIREYTAGRTPNPDVMCNKYVKFGRFLEFAQARGADCIATGHYAQKVNTPSGAILKRGIDTDKDQSYFLWTLTQTQLQSVLLPVGDSPKSKIRAEAERAGLTTAHKKDSQGVCFLGHIDIPEFISHYYDLRPGPVLLEGGGTIGEHKGALVYTTGQRHGFIIKTTGQNTEPHYVVARDLQENTITVSTKKPTLPEKSSIEISAVNWVLKTPTLGDTYTIQTRYRQTPIQATVSATSDNAITLTTETVSEVPSRGQSCVLYQQDICIGGGIIL
jgi:tRNA-uridine 2-sulfurtransferase